MPNRILKESIRTSDRINELSWFEECLFYRLIVSCDDYGRFDGRPAIIKGLCFPLKENVTVKTIENALNKLAMAELVDLYKVDGKPYLSLPTWEQHQTVRATKSKYPGPDESDLKESENNCKQLQADESRCSRIRIRESYSESNSNSDILRGAETPLAEVEAVFLNDGSEWTCPLEDYEEYKRLYPGVDIDTAFREMRAWSKSNPTKRKTKRGIKRFVNGWLSREQDKPKIQKSDSKPKNSFANFEQRNTDYDALVAKYSGFGGRK